MTTEIATRAYGFFAVRVESIETLTPSFRRFVFVGKDLERFAASGFDQRIKLFFPTPTAGIDVVPRGESWYERWRTMDAGHRPAMRTYTTRGLHQRGDGSCALWVDMVAHAVLGPASAWIADAAVGDEVLVYAPTTEREGVDFGVDFVPPAHTEHLLLVGDETAAPAIAVILEQLPRDASGIVVVELPERRDAAYLPSHPGFVYRVTGRDDSGIAGAEAQTSPRGAHLAAGVQQAAAELVPPGTGAPVAEIDVDTDILWEVPRTAKGGAALKSAHLYAWLAGEAGVITALRRHLVTERGIDLRAVAFMGYWREGRAEN